MLEQVEGPGARELVAALAEDPDPALRRASATWLGARGPDDTATAALLATLADDPDAGVQWAAGEALGECGPEGLALLVRRLGHEANAARGQAVRALTRTGAAAADAVARELASGDRRARWNAAVVLAQIGVERHLSALAEARDLEDGAGRDAGAFDEALEAIQRRARRRR